MSYSPNYGGLIWTNHAIRRLTDRGISQENALKTFRNPDNTKDGKGGSYVYEKTFGDETVYLVMKKNDINEWIVVSCWMDPPLPGTKDAREREAYLQYKKASGFMKFLLLIKRQLGI